MRVVRFQLVRFALFAGSFMGAGCTASEANAPRPGNDTDGVTVEYVGHAAVVIEAADGTRVLIDPYNGSKWMGYTFPSDLEADAVLITHPHYDHDAAWNVSAGTPVYREPLTQDIGPVRIIGVEGEHSGGQRFRDRGIEPYNVMWVVDVGGLRLAHTGDNGAPTERMLDEIGRVDVLFTHPFFPVDSVAAAWAPSGVRVIVPVHTRLPELAVESFRLPTVDQWLRGKRPIRDVGNRARYTAEAFGERMEYHVYAPSVGVASWNRELVQAWELSAQAGVEGLSGDSALALRAAAAQFGPQIMTLQVGYAQGLVNVGRAGDAEGVLESALGGAWVGDTEQTIRAHGLLGVLLEARGMSEEAAEHFAVVLAAGRTYAGEAVAAAGGSPGAR